MDAVIEELQEINRKIQEAQSKRDQEEGQRRQLLSQLKDEFGISSYEEAKNQCEKEALRLEQMERELKENIRVLKEESKWDF